MFKTSGILIVNCTILNGKQENTAATLLVKNLNVLDYEVEKISVICENENVVSKELEEFSNQYDIVIVVYDFKDNVVFKALSNMCGEQLTSSLNFSKFMNNYGELCFDYKLPPSAKLLISDNVPFPIIYFQRIFILNENYIQQLFNDILKSHLEQYTKEPTYTKILRVQLNGNTTAVQEKLQNIQGVSVKGHPNTLTDIIIENNDFEATVECEKLLLQELGDSCVERREVINDLISIYESKEDHIHQAIESIERCLKQYGPESVFLSFNGGKDCTVLLHLVHTVMRMRYPNYKKRLCCLYSKYESTFPEQTKFISQCQVYYNLEIIEYSLGIKDALGNILEKKPNMKACLMGTRRTDPFSGDLNTFQLTDPDWPQIIRVSPILDWHYSYVWDYLLFYKVPYCKLYDYGYTSLGNASNTIRNNSLYYYDVKLGKHVYLPAYKMSRESKERIGRAVSDK